MGYLRRCFEKSKRCDDTFQTHIQVFVLRQDRFLAPGDNSCQGREDDLKITNTVKAKEST